jgi:SET domain-containing protein
MSVKLINHLENDIYCRIGISKISGIGIIAVRDIPKNTNPFKNSDGECSKFKIVRIHKDKLKKVHPNVIKILEDFFDDFDDDNYYPVPSLGPNTIDMSFYLNHSDKPNLTTSFVKNCDYNIVKTLRHIKEGEELTFDYKEFSVKYKVNYFE